MGIWEGILSAAGLIALGWYAHAFFHRRKLDDLDKEKKGIPVVEDAEEGPRIRAGAHDEALNVEAIELNEDDINILHRISIHNLQRPASWSVAKMRLILARLSDHGLIEHGIEGHYATRLGLEWLDAAGLID